MRLSQSVRNNHISRLKWTKIKCLKRWIFEILHSSCSRVLPPHRDDSLTHTHNIRTHSAPSLCICSLDSKILQPEQLPDVWSLTSRILQLPGPLLWILKIEAHTFRNSPGWQVLLYESIQLSIHPETPAAGIIYLPHHKLRIHIYPEFGAWNWIVSLLICL